VSQPSDSDTATVDRNAPPSSPDPRAAARQIVLVTGLAGAGMTTALKTLEDQGYEVIDNLPLALIPAAAERSELFAHRLALGLDTRTHDFGVDRLIAVADQLRQMPEVSIRLLFMVADAEVLQRRFTETRRRHPMAKDRPLMDGISAEMALLEPLRRVADLVIDSSQMTIHQCRALIAGNFAETNTSTLRVCTTSFSFKHGVPRDADLLFDVRFLRNPHWEPALRALTGRDSDVAAYIEADPDLADFLKHLRALVGPLLPRYRQEGKAYLTIAFGCTGGQHRSVYCAESVGAWVRSEGYDCTIRHRELD
jgi:RNase adapter protein RapZ